MRLSQSSWRRRQVCHCLHWSCWKGNEGTLRFTWANLMKETEDKRTVLVERLWLLVCVLWDILLPNSISNSRGKANIMSMSKKQSLRCSLWLPLCQTCLSTPKSHQSLTLMFPDIRSDFLVLISSTRVIWAVEQSPKHFDLSWRSGLWLLR